MQISITIEAKSVCKQIDPDDPTKTIDHTTVAAPIVLTGDTLTDFINGFLRPIYNVQDANHEFSGQQVLDAVMARPLRESNDMFVRKMVSALEAQGSGQSLRERFASIVGNDTVKDMNIQ